MSKTRPATKPSRRGKARYLPAVTKAQFARMSQPRQIVAVAEDVLARLRLKQLKVTSGVWVEIPDFNEDGNQDSTDLQTLMKAGRKCEVCAIGGAMCSYAAIADSITVEEDYGSAELDDGYDQIVSVFGRDLMEEMEYCFEAGNGAFSCYGMGEDRLAQLDAFIHRYPNYGDRFRAIFKDLVKNKGAFLP